MDLGSDRGRRFRDRQSRLEAEIRCSGSLIDATATAKVLGYSSVEPDDLSLLRSVLADAESSGEFRVSYRAICGAPLDQAFLGNGWTSHLAMTDSDEHKLPLDDSARRAALATARANAAEILAASDEELENIVPPLEVLPP